MSSRPLPVLLWLAGIFGRRCRPWVASAAKAHPFDKRVPENLREQLHFGHGEDFYWHHKDSEKAADKIDSFVTFGRGVMERLDAIAAACQVVTGLNSAGHLARVEPWTLADANCRLSLRRAVVMLRRDVAPLQTQAGNQSHLRMPRLDDLSAIGGYHWAVAAAALNRTRARINRHWAERSSAQSIVTAWADLTSDLARETELLRWHVTYHILVSSFPPTFPPLVYHRFCCSSAEVLLQIARHAGVLSLPSAAVVEVGVETGATSEVLASMLPPHVRYYGVDPLQWEGDPFGRVSIEGSEGVRAAVRKVYARARPGGGAQLLETTSREAARSSTFKGGGVDLVFIDGNHSRNAVWEDIIAWMKVLQVPAPTCRRRVLAGHDFTLLHAGVLQSVTQFALGYKSFGLPFSEFGGKSGRQHGAPQRQHFIGSDVSIAANSVWWVAFDVGCSGKSGR